MALQCFTSRLDVTGLVVLLGCGSGPGVPVVDAAEIIAVMLGVRAGLLVLLGRRAVSRWWRVWLLVPLWVSMLGVVQARTQT
jgi:hypothetical protein